MSPQRFIVLSQMLDLLVLLGEPFFDSLVLLNLSLEGNVKASFRFIGFDCLLQSAHLCL